MPTQTWYLRSNNIDPTPSPANHLTMWSSNPSAANTHFGTGWKVGTYNDRVAEMAAGVMRDAGWNNSNFTAYYDKQPNNSLGNCIRSITPIKGIYAAGNWNFYFVLAATTGSGYGNGYPFFSVWKSVDPTGVDAVQILSNRTHAAQTMNQTERTFTTTVSLSELNFNNEYFFIQIGWRITTPGGSGTNNVTFFHGPTATRMETSDFNPTQDVTLTGTGIDSLVENPISVEATAGPVSITMGTVNEIQAVTDTDDNYTINPGPVSASFEGIDIEPEFDTQFEASYNAREVVWLLDRYLI